MSKINVNNIEANDASTDITVTTGGSQSLLVDTDGKLTVAGNLSVNGNNYPSAGPLSNRNLIINGAMQVAQRSTSVTGVTSSGYYTADRFNLNTNDQATYTVEQSSDAPTGFENSFKITVTTADGAVAADNYAACHYLIEGYDAAQLGFGASGAKSFTLSFWVKSSETGTFGLNFQNSANNRDFDTTYTVNTANTWEHKEIYISGDTSGTWLKTNGAGLKLWWSLLVGSTYEAPSVSTNWGSTVYLGVNGQKQLSSIVNATWQITGVQLEVGDTATPFEHRSYGDTLHACKRYFQRHDNANSAYRWFGAGYTTSTTTGWYGVTLDPIMRTTPTLTTTDATKFIIDAYTGGTGTTALSLNFSSPHVARIAPTVSGVTANTPSWLASNGDSELRALYFDAEL